MSVTFPELKAQNSLAFNEKHFYHWSADSAAVGLFGPRGPFLPRAGLGVGWLCYTRPPPFPTGLPAVWAGPSAGAEVQGSRLSAGAKAKHRATPRVRGGAGYPRKVLSMPGLMCRGRRGGRFGLLMWPSFGDVTANCFRPQRSLLYSEAEWGPLEGFQWAPSRRPVEASLYRGREEARRAGGGCLGHLPRGAAGSCWSRIDCEERASRIRGGA